MSSFLFPLPVSPGSAVLRFDDGREFVYRSVDQSLLRTARRAESQSNASADEGVLFNFFGALVHVRFAHPGCERQTRRYFGPHVVTTRRTPDLYFRVVSEVPSRHLFRARPADDAGTPLPDVSWRPRDSPVFTEWTSIMPPLPPMTEAPLAGRLVGLHAASLVFGSEGVIIAGDRGAGKTTVSMAVARRRGWCLAGDEDAIVLCGTNVAMPFAHALNVVDPSTDGSSEKRYVVLDPSSYNLAGPAPIRFVVVIRASTHRLWREALPPSEVFEHLVRCHRAAGSSHLRGLETLQTVVESSLHLWVEWSTQDELSELTSEIASWVEQRTRASAPSAPPRRPTVGESLTGVSTRPAHAGDVDALAKLHRDTYAATYRHMLPEDAFPSLERRREAWFGLVGSEDSVTLVAETKQGLVGFLHASRNGSVVELQALYIDVEWQRHGLGTRLLSALVNSAGFDRSSRVVLQVLASNDGAIHFYAAHGFESEGVVARRPSAMGEQVDILQMARTPRA